MYKIFFLIMFLVIIHTSDYIIFIYLYTRWIIWLLYTSFCRPTPKGVDLDNLNRRRPHVIIIMYILYSCCSSYLQIIILWWVETHAAFVICGYGRTFISVPSKYWRKEYARIYIIIIICHPVATYSTLKRTFRYRYVYLQWR